MPLNCHWVAKAAPLLHMDSGMHAWFTRITRYHAHGVCCPLKKEAE
jgi:hypothetical protein